MNDKHTEWITSIVDLGKDRFATSSGDGTIKIWHIDSETRLTLLSTLRKHTGGVISILKIRNNEKLVSCSYDNKLVVWDLRNYSIIYEIDGVSCLFVNGIKELIRQRIIVAGDNILVVVDCLKGNIIHQIPIETKVTCFELINDYLLAGCFDGSYLQIDIHSYDVKMKEEKETNYITSLLKLPKNVLVVGLHNGIVKIYSY